MANRFGWGMMNPQFGQQRTWYAPYQQPENSMTPSQMRSKGWSYSTLQGQEDKGPQWTKWNQQGGDTGRGGWDVYSGNILDEHWDKPKYQMMYTQNSPGGGTSGAPVLVTGGYGGAGGGGFGGGGSGGGGGGFGGQQPWQGMAPVNYQGQGVGGGYMSGAMEAEMGRAKERMNQGFADAARRMGQSGMLMSSDYSQALGGVARNAMNDVNAQGYNYAFNAAQQDANRALQEWQQQGNWDFGAWNADQDRSLSGWKTAGDWDMQAQLANSQQNDQQLMQIMSMLGGMF